MARQIREEVIGLSAKLNKISKAQEETQTLLRDFISYEERIEKIVEEKVYDIKGLVYLTLILVAVIFAMIMGVLLKIFFG